MGIHVDVSHLSREECSLIVDVIAKDITLRKFEQERIRKLRKVLDELRRSITLKYSKQRSLDDNCHICNRTLLKYCCYFYRGQRCLACQHVACPKCRNVLIDGREEKNYLCFVCVKKRELKRKSFESFYEALELRFKRFGSAKVLRGIYRGHKVDARVITLLSISREMTLAGVNKRSSLSRRSSVCKIPSGYSSVRSISPAYGTSSDIESDLFSEHKTATRSKSTDDLGPIASETSTKLKRPQRSRKISAPACLQMKTIQPVEKPIPEDTQATSEEIISRSSENSDFEIISSDQGLDPPEDDLSKEASFTIKFFDEVDFITVASVAFILAIFLSFLACVGYIDVFQNVSEEEDEKTK